MATARLKTTSCAQTGDVSADVTGWSWFAQLGYLFPDTAWELAVRYGWYNHDISGGATFGENEIAGAVNYYIDGHADKLTVDYTMIQADDAGNFFSDTYAGYNATLTSDATLLRFQWQLAL